MTDEEKVKAKRPRAICEEARGLCGSDYFIFKNSTIAWSMGCGRSILEAWADAARRIADGKET